MNIQEQIEALTQELRPYPEKPFYYFEGHGIRQTYPYLVSDISFYKLAWTESLFASTNIAEVEEYADCYRRLKLYQLLAQKAALKYPIDWNQSLQAKYGTDFFAPGVYDVVPLEGRVVGTLKYCCLGSAWFVNEEDRLEALKICGIDKSFQEKCAKYGFGG
jgi:hypothetical protein